MNIAESKPIFGKELDEAKEARLDAEGDAAIDAGQFVTYDRVVV